jgi:long-chain acyl-CoA synthetase
MDSLFEQSMVIGDNRPYLSALLVLNPEQWKILAEQLNLDPDDPHACDNQQVNETVLERIAKQIAAFPGYAQVRRVHCQLQPWSIEDGLITPTLKLKRDKVYARYQTDIDAMYQDH